MENTIIIKAGNLIENDKVILNPSEGSTGVIAAGEYPLVLNFTYNGQTGRIYGQRVWQNTYEGMKVLNIDIDDCGLSIPNDEYLTDFEVLNNS
jgi:hypothetical protein